MVEKIVCRVRESMARRENSDNFPYLHLSLLDTLAQSTSTVLKTHTKNSEERECWLSKQTPSGEKSGKQSRGKLIGKWIFKNFLLPPLLSRWANLSTFLWFPMEFHPYLFTLRSALWSSQPTTLFPARSRQIVEWKIPTELIEELFKLGQILAVQGYSQTSRGRMREKPRQT